MAFESILFDRAADAVAARTATEPACFGDLHLDQIVASLTGGREEYELAPFFSFPLRSVESVRYRHHVLSDLQQEDVLAAVQAFAAGMRRMREHFALSQKLHYDLQKQRWLLDAGAVYCSVVGAFDEALTTVELQSPGFTSLRDYLGRYTTSDDFAALTADTDRCRAELSALTYSVLIRGRRVKVTEFAGEADMSVEVERAFAKFARGAVRDYRVRFREPADMNHIEAQILGFVAKLFPEPFGRLADWCERHREFPDATIGRFDREVQFYLAYLEHIAPLKDRGLAFSYPRVSGRSKEVSAANTFDLSLAAKLATETAPIVTNDLHLEAAERILVVSGPNNGGKTTFARTFGQLHYLASLGLPVPGRDARLFLADRIYTHFEREEDIETLRGKFEDELFRIHEILECATADSVLIMNESFGSTTLHDAVVVGTEVMRQIIGLGALCVFVTFVDELASLGDSTVSMMSTVVPDDPAVRTFKVVRKPADGLAYATALAEKYGLSTESLRRRIAR
jgi:DNA mismatch repair protein MutS